MSDATYEVVCLECGMDVHEAHTDDTWSMRLHRMRHCPNAGFEVRHYA